MKQKPILLNKDMNDDFKSGNFDELINKITNKTENGYTEDLLSDIDTVKVFLKREVSTKINNIGANVNKKSKETRKGQSETMKTSFLEEYFFIVFKSLFFLVIFVVIYYLWFNKTDTATAAKSGSAQEFNPKIQVN